MHESVGRFHISDCFISKLEVKLKNEKGKHTFSDVLSKGLPNADPFPAQERPETHGVSLFSIRSQIEIR